MADAVRGRGGRGEAARGKLYGKGYEMTIEERLEKVEARQARGKRWLVAGAGIILIALVSLAAVQQTHLKTVRAGSFVVVDEEGNCRAELTLIEDGPGLALFDGEGNRRVELKVTEDGSTLTLFDEEGNLRAGMGIIEAGPGLALYDEEGRMVWSAKE